MRRTVYTGGMSPRVLRRKLQKKAKHKPYRRCPKCGGRMVCRLIEGDHDGWHLWKYCGELYFLHNYVSAENARCRPTADGCGHCEELFWSGGGTGRQ
jgi:hypothetical protein